MCLNITHLFWLDASLSERLLDHRHLRGTTRHRQATARAILIHRRAANNRQDLIPCLLSIRKALEHNYATALAAHVAIG